jgi:hydroxymethylbilane synthase
MIDTTAERAFLGALEGGCQVPIGALVAREGTRPTLHGFIADVQGKRVLRASLALDEADPRVTGTRLASELRARGATEILDGLHRADHVPSPQPE